MSTQRALPDAAARSAPRSGVGRRPPQSTPVDQLRRLSDRFDILIRDVSAGVRSHRELERLVNEGEEIAAGIRAVFRGAQENAQVHPPLWQRGGQAMW